MDVKNIKFVQCPDRSYDIILNESERIPLTFTLRITPKEIGNLYLQEAPQEIIDYLLDEGFIKMRPDWNIDRTIFENGAIYPGVEFLPKFFDNITI